MKIRHRRTVSCVAACALLWVQAHAQQSPAPPAREIPRPDQLEPGVDTTAASPAAEKPAPAPAPASAPAAAAAAGTPPQRAAAAAAPSKAGAAASQGTGKKGADRLELDTTDITGNRELPKVLYIVPWKRSDLGDVVGKPVNSLLDEVLQPLDRDVFRRENRYYEGLKSDSSAPKTGAVQGSGSNP
jgi:hypothetical protein